MEIPYGGKVRIELIVRRFAKKVFYNVCGDKSGNYIVEPCMLSPHSSLDFPYITIINDKGGHGTSWENLYSNYEQAEKEVKLRNELYNHFKHKPFLSWEILKDKFQDLKKIENDITKLLKGFEDFDGIDFCDVGANGIQVRGHHKQIPNYTYGSQPTIKYDFSNKENIVMEFVSMWYSQDTPAKILKEKAFIKAGEETGWN